MLYKWGPTQAFLSIMTPHLYLSTIQRESRTWLLYLSLVLKVETSWPQSKYQTVSTNFSYKMTLILTVILSGTFSEFKTQEKIVRTASILLIWWNLTATITKEWDLLFTVLKKLKNMNVGGTETVLTFLTISRRGKRKTSITFQAQLETLPSQPRQVSPPI